MARIVGLSSEAREAVSFLLGRESEDAPFRFSRRGAGLERVGLFESLPIWVLWGRALRPGSTARSNLAELTEPTSDWHHQLRRVVGSEGLGAEPLGYARTRGSETEWRVLQVGSTGRDPADPSRVAPSQEGQTPVIPTEQRIHDALLDLAEPGLFSEEAEVRMLEVPYFRLRALWVVEPDAVDVVYVLERPDTYEELVLAEPMEETAFLEQLRALIRGRRVMQGLEAPPR